MRLKSLLASSLPDSALVHLQAYDHYFRGEPELRLLSRVCDPAKLSLDVGANIGTYSYFMRKYSKRVIAFEPNPQLYPKLRVRFPDVLVYHCACSDKPGKAVLQIPPDEARFLHEQGSIADATIDNGSQCFDVQAETLDSFGFEDVGFLKIDAERHDREVLRGALNTIRDSRPRIMVEVTPLLYSQPLPEEFRFITDLNYEGWFRFNGRYYPFAEWDAEIHMNRSLRHQGLGFAEPNVFFLPRHDPFAAVLRAACLR